MLALRIASAGALAAIGAHGARANPGLPAKAIKATYLYKLPDFVQWPAGALPPGEFILCVIGEPVLGDALDRTIAGQTTQRRPIRLRRYPTVAQNPGCQMVFASGSQAQPVAAILQLVRGAPVLTVTDEQQAPGSIGIINFIVVDGRVRFEVDRDAARVNQLAISSKLLTLAVRVRGRTVP